MFIGLFLVVVGMVFLLKNLGFISGDVWGIIWPSALIIFGLYLTLRCRRKELFWERIWRKFEE